MAYSCAKALESRCHAATEQQAILCRETYVSFFVRTHYGGAADIRQIVFKQTFIHQLCQLKQPQTNLEFSAPRPMLTNLSDIFNRTKDSSERDGLHPEHLAKRPCTISPSQRFSPSTGLPAHPPPNGLPTHPPNGLSHPPNPQMGPQHYRLEDMALAHQYRDAYRHSERDRHRQTGRSTTFTGEPTGCWSLEDTTVCWRI